MLMDALKTDIDIDVVYRLQESVEECLQKSIASCVYESRNLVVYRGIISAVDYMCGPSRPGAFTVIDCSLF